MHGTAAQLCTIVYSGALESTSYHDTLSTCTMVLKLTRCELVFPAAQSTDWLGDNVKNFPCGCLLYLPWNKTYPLRSVVPTQLNGGVKIIIASRYSQTLVIRISSDKHLRPAFLKLLYHDTDILIPWYMYHGSKFLEHLRPTLKFVDAYH